MSDTTETVETPDEAERPPLSYLLEVQDLDTKIDQLAHKRATLPERAEIEALGPEAAAAAQRAADAETKKAELEAEQRRLEALDEDLDAKLVEADRTLYGGTLKAMREIEALQHEIEKMKNDQSEAETRILEIFDEVEALDAAIQAARDRQHEVAGDTERLEARLAAAEAEIDAELNDVTARRNDAAARVPDEMLSHYTEYRKYYEGQVVARFEGGNCRGCPLSMPATEADRVKHLPAGTTVTCDECGRYVLR